MKLSFHPDGHFSRRMVTHVLQQSTRGVPASWALSRRLFDLAPAGVCRAAHVTVSAVGSYPTFSPLPAILGRRFVFCGTVRRAEMHAQELPGNLAQWSPDFPRREEFSRSRPSDQ